MIAMTILILILLLIGVALVLSGRSQDAASSNPDDYTGCIVWGLGCVFIFAAVVTLLGWLAQLWATGVI